MHLRYTHNLIEKWIFLIVNRESKRFYQKRTLWWILPLVIVLLVLIYHLIHPSKNTKTKAPLPVVAATALSRDVPVYLNGLGSVIPTDTVTVRTQINGQILHIYFKEGQKVAAGDLLVQIDPRPYEAQLKQFEGQLARDLAQLENAKRDLQRYQTLFKQDSVSGQILDTQKAQVLQLQGTVALDQAQIDNTKLNLMYCRISAPIAGKVGIRLVDLGNYVQTSDANGIVVLNNINPITVIFTLPEDNLPAVMSKVNTGQTLTANAYDRTQNNLLAQGQLIAVDNQIDINTGTVKLRAQFQNEHDILFPNQFVNIRLLVDTLKNATVIPTAAIQHGSQGTFVYVMQKNATVNVVPVTASVTFNDQTAIKAGLRPGQAVVVEGVDKLYDGAKISVAKTGRKV